MKKNFCIIGAGWYGCHIGLFLKNLGNKVKIFEKEKDIFLGSSGYNQFRLHSGFHYPRSSETINEIKINYSKFCKFYKKYISIPKNNIYCIAQQKSLIDAKTYEIILKSHGLKIIRKKTEFLKNIESAYNCKEAVLLNTKIKQFFKKKLKKNLILNKKVNSILNLSKKFDYVLDCTNNTFQNYLNKDFNFILTISLVYKKRGKNKVYPVTIMDGKLPSLFPYADKKNLFTLTHSKYTHIKKFKKFSLLENFKKKLKKKNISKIKNDMEKDISFYYPKFKKVLDYKTYFFSYKVLPKENSDKRSVLIKRNKNIISCSSPKIANIFTFQKYIRKLIKK